MKNLNFIYTRVMIGILVSLLIIGCNSKSNSESEKQSNSSIESTENKTNTEMNQYKDDIYVKTIQIGGESKDEKNRLQLSYPHTKYAFINKIEEKLAMEYKEEFMAEAEKFDQNSVAGVTFLQHFEVVEHTDSLIIFMIEKSQSYGNNFTDKTFTRYYDLINQQQIEVIDLFQSKNTFEAFAEIVKKQLKISIREILEKDRNSTEKEKQMMLQNLQGDIDAGTAAKAENYNSILFNKDGNVVVRFNKYQVAPGYMGVIDVDVPQNQVRPLLKSRYQQLLNIKKDEKIEVSTSNDQIKKKKIDQNKPVIALTFDDGPSIYTPKLLDILKEQNVHVTFFVLGKSAKVQKNTVLRAYHEGHQIANHSWNHKDLTKVSNDEVQHQVFDTNDIIKEITEKNPTVLRPPYGALNSNVKDISEMPIILWNLDPLDWKDKNAEIVAERISKANANAIILAHDIHKTTVEAIPQVIKSLHDKGYVFITIDEMFENIELVNGKKYFKKVD